MSSKPVVTQRKLFCILSFFFTFNVILSQEYDTLYYREGGDTFTRSAKENASFYQVIPSGTYASRNGQVPVYYLTGEKKGYLTYTNGAENGEFKFYFKTGGLQWAGTYQNGQVVGLEKEWYPSNQLKAERIYYPRADENTPPEMKVRSFWDSLGNQTVINGKGKYETFYKNSSPHLVGTYDNGKKVGKWTSYRSDGSIYYTEFYDENSKLVKGESFDRAGVSYTYTTLRTRAAFPGGPAAWSEFLKKKLKYPQQAQTRGLEANLMLSFIVDKDGQIYDIKAIKELGYGFDREGIRVLKKSPKWTPGIERGQKVKSRMQIQLQFRLR